MFESISHQPILKDDIFLFDVIALSLINFEIHEFFASKEKERELQNCWINNSENTVQSLGCAKAELQIANAKQYNG